MGFNIIILKMNRIIGSVNINTALGRLKIAFSEHIAHRVPRLRIKIGTCVGGNGHVVPGCDISLECNVIAVDIYSTTGIESPLGKHIAAKDMIFATGFRMSVSIHYQVAISFYSTSKCNVVMCFYGYIAFAYHLFMP